jgi:serine/threonine-protein kinase
VDREGREVAQIEVEERRFELPRLSPDGKSLAVTVRSSGGSDIWVHDIAGSTRTRLTFEGINRFPAWTRDGRHVTFASNRANSWGLYLQQADGSRDAERLLSSPNELYTGTWSPDDQVLAFEELMPDDPGEILTVRRAGDGQAALFVTGPRFQSAPAFSPDGRWLAYVSDESGRREVYVRSYPDGIGKWTVSTAGGQEPVWSHDGRELFFRNGFELWAAPVRPGDTFSVGRPDMLFTAPFARRDGTSPNFDVHPDGQRFLMIKSTGAATAAAITIVLNWVEELKRLVPARR